MQFQIFLKDTNPNIMKRLPCGKISYFPEFGNFNQWSIGHQTITILEYKILSYLMIATCRL